MLEDSPPRYNELVVTPVLAVHIHAVRPSSLAENPRIRRCLSLLCPEKLKVDGLNKVVIATMCIRCEAQACGVLERPVCVSFSSLLYSG